MRKFAFKHSGKESQTQQQFRDSSKTQNIMNRALKTGVLPGHNRRPIFGQIPSFDFMEAQNKVIDARAAFDSLPAKVRRAFENDPYQLIRAFENPDMRPKLEELGLVEKQASAPQSDPEANPHKKPPEGA